MRTRIYFTSESHMHSLINVLRYSHLAQQLLPGSGAGGLQPTMSQGSLDAGTGECGAGVGGREQLHSWGAVHGYTACV